MIPPSSSLGGPVDNTKTIPRAAPVCEEQSASLSFNLPRLHPRAPRQLILLDAQTAFDTEQDGLSVAFIEMVHNHHHHHHHLENENILEAIKKEWKSLLLLSLCFVSITAAIVVILVYYSETKDSSSLVR